MLPLIPANMQPSSPWYVRIFIYNIADARVLCPPPGCSGPQSHRETLLVPPRAYVLVHRHSERMRGFRDHRQQLRNAFM